MADINVKANVQRTSTLGKVRILVEQVVGSPSQAQISQAVADYIDNHPGALSPISQATKSALLDIAAHVAYIDANGQSRYDALDAALNAKALLSITAVYTQTGTVYDTDSLDSLKADLVVTAYYDDGTSVVIPSGYTLSGELTEGTSTVTVTFGGKTATFTVTVTHATIQYSVTNTLTNCSNSNSATVINEMTPYTGMLTADTDYVMGTVTITMGGTDITSTAYDSGTGAISIASVTGDIVITAVATARPITVNYNYPITATWNPSSNAGTLSEAVGAIGTVYRVEIDVTSISAQSAYLALQVTGSSAASFGDTKSFAGQTGTITITHRVSYNQEVGATSFKISCNKGSESANQTAVISDIRIYKVQ